MTRMISSKELFNTMKEYKASQNTIKKVQDIFLQGDIRYSDPEYEAIVAGFIDNNAVSIEKKTLEKIPIDTFNIRGPQKGMKAAAIGFLRKLGYEIVSIERGFNGVIPDVLAKEGDSIVALECGPCGIRKAINYLEKDKTSLWIMRPEGDKYELFIVSKSVSWDAFLRFHRKFQSERVREHVERAFQGL
jgi:hypothetical protein